MMALDKLAYLVLPHWPSPDLFRKVSNNMTGRRHCPIGKVVDLIDKNLLLLIGKALVPEGVGFLLCLGKVLNASRNS
jgi:hypothetical protein